MILYLIGTFAGTRWVFYWQPIPYSLALLFATRRVARPPPPAPHPSGVLLAVSTFIRPRCSLRPPVARASRPPPAGSDTRRCSCLRAGQLTRCRWALQPISLLGTNPAGRLTRCRSAPETGSLCPSIRPRAALCDPPGRAPDAAPTRRAPLAQLVIASAGVKRW